MAGEEEKGESKGFKVEDRRRFSSATGEAREKAEESPPPVESREQERGEVHSEDASGSSEKMPEINFSTFVISLSTQALMNLGEVSNPLSGNVEIDIPVAKQMIDILGMIREKTRGNLDAGEEQLMEDILYDLRMRYVEAVKRK